jgi:hypothetical protein
MIQERIQTCDREFDFALVLSGITELSEEVMDNLFAAGCNDATPTLVYGNIWLEFSRTSRSLKDAILSAIRDVCKSNIGAKVVQVAECDLVTQSEIARRIGKSRQYVHQLITGARGLGGFPPPVSQLSEEVLLWQWCAVSWWLCQNNWIKPELVENAETIAAINLALETSHQRGRHPELLEEVTTALANSCK